MTFADLDAFRTALSDLPPPDAAARAAAAARNGQLTKPPGALGRLEAVAEWVAGWQGTDRPRIDRPQVVVFAGNHGVAAQGVSAFPSAVTAQMVANFRAGGAAINQIAALAGAGVQVVALELDRPTADFTEGPAMTGPEAAAALSAGWDVVQADTDALVVGEMGIGNTTSAAALALALFGGTADDWVGRGTGVDDAGLARKRDVVAAGVARHGAGDPLDILAALGGREIAAMAGAIARARAPHPRDPRRVHLHGGGGSAGAGGAGRAGALPCGPRVGGTRTCAPLGGARDGPAPVAGDAAGRRVRRGAGTAGGAGRAGLPVGYGDLCRGRGRGRLGRNGGLSAPRRLPVAGAPRGYLDHVEVPGRRCRQTAQAPAVRCAARADRADRPGGETRDVAGRDGPRPLDYSAATRRRARSGFR